jgi:hypothetical protein
VELGLRIDVDVHVHVDGHIHVHVPVHVRAHTNAPHTEVANTAGVALRVVVAAGISAGTALPGISRRCSPVPPADVAVVIANVNANVIVIVNVNTSVTPRAILCTRTLGHSPRLNQ